MILTQQGRWDIHEILSRMVQGGVGAETQRDRGLMILQIAAADVLTQELLDLVPISERATHARLEMLFLSDALRHQLRSVLPKETPK